MKPVLKKEKNGLRTLFIPMDSTQSVTIMILVKMGSLFENKKNSGISHFLEHMCFKGTKNRTAKDILSEFDGLGAQFNAFTSYERTGYYAKVRGEKAEQALSLLSDIYANSTFPEKELETEKGVVIEEVRMYQDDPVSFLSDKFREIIWAGQSACQSILGTVETINSFSSDKIRKFHQENYVPENTLVVVSGNFDKKKISGLISKHLGKIPSSKKPERKQLKPIAKKSIVATFDKKIDQAHIVFGFRGLPEFDKDEAVLNVLANAFGGMMSSRLFRKVREELGAAYYISSHTRSFSDQGLFMIRAGLSKEKLQIVLEAIVDEINLIKTELISDQELSIAKESILGDLVNNLETSDSWAEHFGYFALMDKKLYTIKDLEREIKAVTKEDVKRLAKSVFKKDCVYLATVDEESKDDLLKKVIDRIS